MIVTFEARWIARAWLAVGLASRPDKDDAMLDRSLHVELYVDGVRLVATDGLVLLTAWVPARGKEGDPPPGYDDAPVEAVTVYDWHGRGRGLFAHLLALVSVDDPPEIEVTLAAGDEARDGAASGLLSFAGMERRQLSVMASGREQILLDVYEGEYPNWRAVVLRHVQRRTGAIALACDVVGRLAGGLAKLYDGPLEWRFGGVDKMALIAIGSIGVEPRLEGVVMPARFTFPKEDD